MRLLLFVATIAFASAVSGATLTVTADKASYFIGETITLTISGDPEGATAYGVFGVLRYNGALVNNGTRSQPTLSGPSGAWVKGFLNQGDTNLNNGGTFSYAFAQISPTPQTATNIPATTLSTVTLIAQSVGMVTVNWDSTNLGFELDFFGLTSAPGTSFRICGDDCPPVPEPATGALIGLGLLALAAGRKRKVC